MNTLLSARTLILASLLSLGGSAHAHGGQYRGPGDTVPPGGGGSGGGGNPGPSGLPGAPGTPGPVSPGTPGVGAPSVPGLSKGPGPGTGIGDSGADRTQWTFWWEFNKEPYLSLKARIHEVGTRSGTDGFFLGLGEKDQGKTSRKPSEQQIREIVVPALLQALARETNNDILTGCLIALAKIGDAPGETSESAFERVITPFLSDKNQEISETAAVALGILANPASIGILRDLLRDSRNGRELVGRPEVGYRTRAFAAYGLGLIGSRASREEDRSEIVKQLRQTLETDSTRTRDLAMSCVIAMGLVKLETIEAGAPAVKGTRLPPETSRCAQLDTLLALLRDEDKHSFVRAHCATALARLLDGLPPEVHARYRQEIATDLLGRIGPKSREQAEVLQSCVLALGQIGTNDGADPLDTAIRASLRELPRNGSDQQTRYFALIALAQIGGTFGKAETEAGVREAGGALLRQLGEGKGNARPWAGLACGVLAESLGKSPAHTTTVGALQQAVRGALEEEKDPTRVGALAISAGIMKDLEAKTILLERLDKEKDDTARGYVAIALGLMNARDAIGKINRIVDESKYRPEMLRQAAIALGLLGDPDLVPKLTALLAESKSRATQASITSALGFIGDERSIDALVALLGNGEMTDGARGFAAVALGIVGDKDPLPWNSRIGLDLNYRASTPTLTDFETGTGILDIL